MKWFHFQERMIPGELASKTGPQILPAGSSASDGNPVCRHAGNLFGRFAPASNQSDLPSVPGPGENFPGGSLAVGHFYISAPFLLSALDRVCPVFQLPHR